MKDLSQLSTEELLMMLQGGATSSEPKPATMTQKVQASTPMRVLQGMRDPIDAGAQFLSHAMPSGVTAALDYLPNKLRGSDSPLAQTLGYTVFGSGTPEAVDTGISENRQNYEQARAMTGQEGMDWSRLFGNVASPANAAIARTLPLKAGATAAKNAIQGLKMGAAGGALGTVDTQQGQEDYWTTKAAQTGLGAATGAALTPVMAKLGNAIVRRLPQNAEITGVRASLEADGVMAKAMKDIGASMDDIPKVQYQALRSQVVEALKGGKKLDAAALIRKADFDALNMPSTTGQITRDATQFAKERNLRGVAGVGEPIMARLEGQNQALQGNIGGYARGATDKFTAGEALAKALQSVDSRLKGRVDTAYSAARDNLGRASPMDVRGFSKAANDALDDGMLGHYLPAEVKGILNDVSTGKIPFNVNTAVQIDSTLSAAQRSAGKGSPQALAIGKVRDALNKAKIADNVGEDAKAAFDAARGMARNRFKIHEAVPALDAVVNEGATAEQLIQRHVINADTQSSKRLADLLSKTDPAAFNQAKAQIGQKLQEAAFGANPAGDQVFSPARYAKALADFGKPKLSVWFSPDEVTQMQRMARVGAYINSTPSAAPVNYSNTAGALASMLGKIPGAGIAGNAATIGKAVVQPVLNQRAVSSALASQVPQTAADLSPEQAKLLAQLLSMGALGAGGIGATGIR